MVSQPFSIATSLDLRATAGRKFAPPPRRQVIRADGKDPFVDALLELPLAHPSHRNPFEWALSLGMHFVLIGVIVAAPLYFTDAIDLKAYAVSMIVAVPPPPPPPPPAGGITKQVARPKVPVILQHAGLVLPTIIPRKIAIVHDEAGPGDANDGVLGGVTGGVPGGVPGGVVGGVLGGVLGSVGSGLSAPPPPTAASGSKKILRVGGKVKPPRLLLSPAPLYPTLAKTAKLQGTVVIDAVIDEKGNVVEARAVSGPGLLIPSALKAITSWKYEPTYLDGEPIEVRMHVDVNFLLQ